MNNSLKRKFIHTDAANLFHRQINMTNPALGVDSAIGMSLHLILYSMKKEFTTFKGTHAVVYLEGSSWRKTAYLPYKADRKVKYAAMTEEEQNTREILTGAFDDFISHIDDVIPQCKFCPTKFTNQQLIAVSKKRGATTVF